MIKGSVKQESTSAHGPRQAETRTEQVEMALQRIQERKIVEMSEAQKAAMVANLMTVLCSEHSVQPVVNTNVQP